ncbi:MAG: hypothetical protein ACYCOU_09580 [Sulfobacillus sp.]
MVTLASRSRGDRGFPNSLPIELMVVDRNPREVFIEAGADLRIASPAELNMMSAILSDRQAFESALLSTLRNKQQPITPGQIVDYTFEVATQTLRNGQPKYVLAARGRFVAK